MPLDFTNAVVYDLETFPNVWTCSAEMLHSDARATWEISPWRDDRTILREWLNWLHSSTVPMIGFNNLYFDYPILHFLWNNPQATVRQLYEKAMSIINGQDRFGHMIWESDRFAPQVDLFKIHHFDNKAKTTSLKALQINMRSQSVEDMPVPVGTELTEQQTRELLIPYNQHDVSETKKFAHISKVNIDFRNGLDVRGDVLNFNDTKIGAKLLEDRIGEEICYIPASRETCPFDGKTQVYNRKRPRQTVRWQIPLAEIIFPYIQFNNPEFRRVLDYLKAQVLKPADFEQNTDSTAPSRIQTKGVFAGLNANVGGLEFQFGTGGIHGSVTAQRIETGGGFIIRDIDVAALYPSIAIENGLAPAHLGQAFIANYRELRAERGKYAKGTVENAALKLALNGTYGNSNNQFSVFYDPQYTMATTINGQLLLCMLAEWLLTVPTLQIIQINTDGITYRIWESMEPFAKEQCKRWEKFTLLTLEDAEYSRMWIRDVNNYVAETTKGKLKQKGAYWHPDVPPNYERSLSEASPSAWYKDLSNVVSVRAAVQAMVKGVNPAQFIQEWRDPFDFMCRAKCDRSSRLVLGDREIQRTTRYYVSTAGAPMRKVSPPVAGASVGDWKRRNGLSEAEFQAVSATLAPGQWDERIHTKNRSKHEQRETSIQAGWLVKECNRADAFDWADVDWRFYEAEAGKLII